jgi:thioredoxin reductase
MSQQLFEALVIGGGPAGLSAALYLARYDRQVALFDTGRGRSTWHQVNQNYLGFPGGVPARELRRVQLCDNGYITVDSEQLTSNPGVYAAGDVTRLHSHQLTTAVHEGGQAASAVNYFLYPAELKDE